MWNITHPRFEDVLVRKWQTMSAKNPRQIFIETFEHELKLFLDVPVVDAVLEAEVRREEIPLALLSKLLSQRIGQQLYQRESEQAKWLLFV